MTDEIVTAEGPIVWEGGGTAQVRDAKDVDVVLRSSVPYPPGKPAKGSLRVGETESPFIVKVSRSQRVIEGVWDVRGRLISATSALREAFATSAVKR
ncbi:MAG: hypothetical protein JNK05_10845 [Myxococcales bacterium]|nr:hypothetical protein [Myxococcales bacterium]